MLAAIPLEGLPTSYPPGTSRRAPSTEAGERRNARTMPG